jgi:hypothetical protein
MDVSSSTEPWAFRNTPAGCSYWFIVIRQGSASGAGTALLLTFTPAFLNSKRLAAVIGNVNILVIIAIGRHNAGEGFSVL